MGVSPSLFSGLSALRLSSTRSSLARLDGAWKWTLDREAQLTEQIVQQIADLEVVEDVGRDVHIAALPLPVERTSVKLERTTTRPENSRYHE